MPVVSDEMVDPQSRTVDFSAVPDVRQIEEAALRAIREALAAEREACARIVEAFDGGYEPMTEEEKAHARSLGCQIGLSLCAGAAEVIRLRNLPETP